MMWVISDKKRAGWWSTIELFYIFSNKKSKKPEKKNNFNHPSKYSLNDAVFALPTHVCRIFKPGLFASFWIEIKMKKINIAKEFSIQ